MALHGDTKLRELGVNRQPAIHNAVVVTFTNDRGPVLTYERREDKEENVILTLCLDCSYWLLMRSFGDWNSSRHYLCYRLGLGSGELFVSAWFPSNAHP